MPTFTEPVLFGLPIHLLVLYFILYSFLGWVQETCYCSIGARHFVSRGFLYGPVCPIYGAGVLLMICFFKPLTGNLLLFYGVSTVCMSAWEYFVGWFLETTTHMKYWDYSNFKFNLKGRICLWVSLTWGALSYIVIFWIHPFVSRQVLRVPMAVRLPVTYLFLGVMLADAAFTIRDLALAAKVMKRLNATREELRLQAALGKAELADRLGGKLEDLQERLADAASSETAERLRARYDEALADAELRTRRLRSAYAKMRAENERYSASLDAVNEAGRAFLARRLEERRARRAAKKNKR